MAFLPLASVQNVGFQQLLNLKTSLKMKWYFYIYKISKISFISQSRSVSLARVLVRSMEVTKIIVARMKLIYCQKTKIKR